MPIISDNSFTHNTAIYHGGRGGAGNYRRLSKSELTTMNSNTPAPNPPVSSSKVFFGGRGGAGNVRSTSERAMFSFDEELERDRIMHEHHAPVYSIGRGGKGNLVSCDDIATRSFYSGASPRNSTDAASRRSSTSSTDGADLQRHTSPFSASSIRSGADRLWDRVRRI